MTTPDPTPSSSSSSSSSSPGSPPAADESVERFEAEFEVLSENATLPWASVLRDVASLVESPNAGQSKWLILTAVLLGNFAAGIVFTLLSVARTTIADDLGAPRRRWFFGRSPRRHWPPPWSPHRSVGWATFVGTNEC